MKRLIAASIISLLLAACVARRPPSPIAAPVDTRALALVNQKGTGKIEGQAFMRQAGGGVVTAAGEMVGLVAATPFTEEAVSRIQAGENVSVSGEAGNLKQYLKTTTADATGGFAFDGMAAGQYIVFTQVKWQVPIGRYSTSQEGGDLVQNVTVAAGKPTKVILSR